MAIIGMLLMGVGGIAMFAGVIWILVIAFQESIVWGLCSLLVPFAILVFTVMNWDKTSKPFLVWLAGFVPYIIGLALTASQIAVMQ